MTFIHPRWLVAVGTYLFPSLCTIQQPANLNVKGEVILEPWAAVGGLIDLPCRVSPTGGREVRGSNMSYSVTTHTITLQSREPTILPHMRAVVDALTYDIEAVEGDGNSVMTRLAVRLLT